MSIERFDDCVRSERYFTATLLPLILFHDGFRGLRRLTELIEQRASTERDEHGASRPRRTPDYRFDDVELVTEFHIARDVSHYGGELAASDAESTGPEKRDAPDLVAVLGRELIVIEAKYFVSFSAIDLQQQLQSQRRQVRHLFAARPSLRAWRHVALLPAPVGGLDCDALLTWDDISALSREVLGPSHYVSRRLDAALARYPKAAASGGREQNYESKITLDQALSLCREQGSRIAIGHAGGESDLRFKGLEYARAKAWKWRRAETGGTIDASNWIAGTRFSKLIESLPAVATAPPATGGSSTRDANFDGVLSLDDMLALCASRGAAILVGHSGGEDNLQMRGLAYARQKRWKWRDPRTNRGVADSANWLRGDRFADVIRRLR